VGVGDDIGLDKALIAEYGMVIHAFDPTPSTIEWLSENKPLIPPTFHFHPWAITDRDGTLTLYPRITKRGQKSRMMYTLVPEKGSIDAGIEVPAFTIKSIMSKLGHHHIDFLKMDIEGAEYAVLEQMLDCTIRPKQILVEFHHRFPGIGMRKTAYLIEKLRIADYRIFAISETGREISFLLDAGSVSRAV
jgi:FkbM family methyltransferase